MPTSDRPPALRCAGCGERLTRGRLPGTLSHVSRLVAACDLDSDHPPVPDPALLGEPPCRRCGAPTTWRSGAFGHVEAHVDHDHPADPVLPAP